MPKSQQQQLEQKAQAQNGEGEFWAYGILDTPLNKDFYQLHQTERPLKSLLKEGLMFLR